MNALNLKNKKRVAARVGAALALCLAAAAGGCRREKPAAAGTRRWTDSAGREVEIAAKLDRAAPSGGLAQIILYSLAPQKVIGWASAWSEDKARYIPETEREKPIFGQYYGQGGFNIEAVIAARPDIVIDVGERKPNIKDDLDGLQAKMGIPVIFVEATMETMSEAYRTLGILLDVNEAAEERAAYIDEVLRDAEERRLRIPVENRRRVYYGEGKNGQTAIASGTIHADVIDYAGAVNVAGGEDADFSGGREASMEQILLWNPDVVLFGRGDGFENAAKDAVWRRVKAVQNGEYYQVPHEPYSWMGRPPSINRLIGIRWLGHILYPSVFDFDMERETRRFYQLFYHFEGENPGY